MKVSVIIPTYNGAHKILNTLQALVEQTHTPDEIVIVIDGSTDNTAELVEANAFSFPELRVVEQDNQGRAVTRNQGAAAASGDLLIFFDDDMRPLPGCVAEHVRHHQHQTGTIAVGTQIEDFDKCTTDFLRYKALTSRKWMQKYAEASSVKLNPAEPFITAANFSLSKALFDQIGGFDSRLTDAEDFDLAMRASEAGIEIYFLNQAQAWHDDLISCRVYVKRLREYRVAHQKLAALRPKLYPKYGRFSPPRPGLLKDAAFSFFAKAQWLNLIDSQNLLVLKPEEVRYKIYDVIITALGVYYTHRPI
ncbi:glycosyltransferase family 2 protein [Hymenobacter sp. BT491]|uniref:glycosyltransferase family 2 protein n=1 Tax=Hymenobacter sp. BT491 TaxID=2766779 RepID=UPI00165349BA|nr:glycosyltransferase family 2 protein [Hymenobacter sp. BT491]MBC6988297.1 glycosyltransferase family 2 protein [Hymenobacter sp. BT491]